MLNKVLEKKEKSKNPPLEVGDKKKQDLCVSFCVTYGNNKKETQ